MAIKTTRLQTGIFSVIDEDNIITKFRIVNGCSGMSGYGNNHYGILNTENHKVEWIGSLAKCKKVVNFWVSKSKEVIKNG